MKKIDQLIGNTPILALGNIEKHNQLKGHIYAKIEGANPAGSIKDRIAKAMVDGAEKEGKLTPGATIIEPTSGNTGIGLAAVGASRGYKVILTMPETMSVERRNMIKAYGAQVVLTPGALGMKGAIEKANELHREMEGSFVPGQFENPNNPKVHYQTTGPEIWSAMAGKVDVLVAGVGTGGTISGAGKYLKEQNPKIEVVAIEPADSPILSKGTAGPHKIQGIGAGFVPKNLDTTIYDRVITVTNDQAFETGRMVGKKEGVLVGISSGAALFGAMELAKQEAYEGKNIVVIFPDGGDRYFSTALYTAE